MFNWLKKIFVDDTPASGDRARNSKGHYVADNKSTPNVNEAYTDGKTPPAKKTTAKKQVVTKKKAPVKKKVVAKKAPAKKGRTNTKKK